MPADPFNPADSGFGGGSAVFGYSPAARKAINEACLRLRGDSAYSEFWEKVLTSDERKELGNDVKACRANEPFSMNLLSRLRNWSPERSVVEIAYCLELLTPQAYSWLREVAGDPRPRDLNDSARPIWDRKTGRLEYQGKLCRRLTVARATSVGPVLDAFQDAGWPATLKFTNDTVDPQRIHQVVSKLNQGLLHIHFGAQNGCIFWHPKKA